MVSIDGLISGLDTESIVQGLLEVQQTQIDRLTLKKKNVLDQQAAFQSLEAQLISFRSAASRLSRVQNSVFESRTVTSSDEQALVATASSGATTGVYQLSIESLAQAHQVASQGFTDADAEITQGTFTFRQGSQPEVTITIDSNNNTLQGLADSINLADSGIQASIVNDGTATPYRLLLTSNKTGADHAISVTNNLAADSGQTVKPTLDFGNPVQAAANAQIKLGQGAGALVIETETNRVEDLIDGVKIDLLQADPGRVIQLRVENNTEPAVNAVQDFVDAYNSVVDFIDAQTRFVPETGESGLLIGNRSLVQIEAELQGALQTVVPSLSSDLNRLSSIGIDFTDQGKLTFNPSELQRVLNGEVDGVSSEDVRRLFALDGTSTNPNIDYVLGTTRTQEGTFEVDITQAAERAAITGTNSIAASTVITDLNNQLDLTVDGQEITVTLKSGTYDEAALAQELESTINAHPDMKGRAVSVGLADNAGNTHLTVTSDTYGGSSQITIRSGSAFADLGFTGVENDQGVNVEGVFLVNGVEEPAKGSGRLLSGLADNEHTADLQLRITLTPGQVVAGVDGEIEVARGVAARLDQLIGDFLDSETGQFSVLKDQYDADAENIQDSIDRQQALFEKQQEDLIAQFVALESAISELQNTGDFLSQQFAALSQQSRAKK